jgi:L-threonylcarbamoyladenylate synthase
VPRLPETRVLVVDPADPDRAVLDRAAQIMKNGGLVAFATETVYGLGAVATEAAAVAKIYAAKGRPAVNPLIVHVTGIAQARECVRGWPERAERLASRYWPGPLTIVLERAEIVPEIVTAGRATVGVRAPRGLVARGLIERVGEPIAAPSANRSNRISPTRAEHVVADLEGEIELVIDSGPTAVGIESTVVDLTGEIPRVLRPGPISRQDLEAALAGETVLEDGPGASERAPASPGQMPVHYAPRTPAYRAGSVEELAGIDTRDCAVIVFGDHKGARTDPGRGQFVMETPEDAARLLYELLHRCDGLGKAAIVVVLPPEKPEWRAVRDRLMRACRPVTRSFE